MKDTTQLFPTETYILNGIRYVPHYRNVAVFVGPGYPKQAPNRYTAQDLLSAGAEKSVFMLWSRGAHGKVDDANP
jgi:hypothetical protein